MCANRQSRAELTANEVFALRMQVAGFRLKDVGCLLGVSAQRAAQITQRARQKAAMLTAAEARVERQAALERERDEAWHSRREAIEWHVQEAYLLLLRGRGRDVWRA